MAPNTIAEAEKFVTQSLEIKSLISSIFQNVQKHPEELETSLEQLESLEVFARRVQTLSFYGERETGTILCQCNALAEKVLSLFNDIEVEAAQLKTWRNICSEKKEAEILDLFAKLYERHCALDSQLSTAISEIIEGQILCLQPKPDVIQKEGKFAFNTEKCLQNLFTTDVSNDRVEIKAAKGDSVPGTWDWVLRRREFTEWQASDSGLLWISGRPGSGKTMLAVHMTEQIQLAQSPNEILLYYFFDASLGIRNNAVCLLKNLIYQLVQLGKDSSRYHVTWRTSRFIVLWDIFLDILRHMNNCRVVCVLDGLDECEPGSLELLCSQIGTLISELPVKLVILSREHPQVLDHFLGQYPRIRLDADNDDDIKGALQKYIAMRISELPMIGEYPAELRRRTQEFLSQHSHGSYLWTSLAIKGLGSILASDVGAYLDEFPEGLEQVYDCQMRQVEPQQREFVRDVLRWCAFSKKPMELGLLAEAVSTQAEGSLTPTEVLRGQLQHCGLLVTISKHSRKYVILVSPGKAETILRGDYETVTLAHQSVRDFLTQASLSEEWFSLHNVAVQHLELAIRCLGSVYSMGGQWDEKKAQVENCPSFWDYANRSWSYHFQRSDKHAVELVRDFPQYFGNSPWLNRWFTSMRIHKGSVRWRLGLAAAALGLEHLVQHVVDAEKTKLRLLKVKFLRRLLMRTLGTTPLHLAAEHGHLSIVEMLMGKIRLDTKDKEHHEPLFQAGMGGHVEIVKFLLKSGADRSAQYSFYQAMWQRSEAMMEILLESSPPMSTWGLDAATRIPMRINGVQDSMVALLLPVYARQEAEKTRRWDRLSALHVPDWMKRIIVSRPKPQKWDHFSIVLLAAMRGHTSVETIRALLELPDTDLSSEDMQRCLRVALSHRDVPVIKLLVEEYHVPLPNPDAVHCVVDDELQERSLRKLRLLVEDYKVDPNLFSTRHREETPLASAIRDNNNAAVRYLIDECHIDPEGICKRAKGNDLAKTAIEVAALNKKFEMMPLLLEKKKARGLENKAVS